MIGYLELMRPRQWIKNLAVVAGPAFALKVDPVSVMKTFEAVAAFCLVSSASYAINDVFDRRADAQHPVKRNRPVARGDVSPFGAIVWAVVLLAGGAGLAWARLPISAAATVAAYFVMILAYSMALKRRMILDVILIAVGFVLRAVAGAEAVGAFVSPWLVVCTFTLCLFMGFGKRRCEIAQFSSVEQAREHRVTLGRYTPELLNHLISVSAGIAIITFLLILDRDIPTSFNKEHLVYTLPFVVYGIFRFAMLAQSGGFHGPMEIFLGDRPLLLNIIVWGLIAVLVMTEDYWVSRLGLAP